jgi:hypothetical protein
MIEHGIADIAEIETFAGNGQRLLHGYERLESRCQVRTRCDIVMIEERE